MKIGRRTNRLAVPKDYLMTLIDTLHRRGLGTRSIATLTGYSATTVRHYIQDLGRPRHTPTSIARGILDHLPPELISDCLRVRLKSDAAKERGEAKANGVCVARVEYELLDHDGGMCVNSNREAPARP